MTDQDNLRNRIAEVIHRTESPLHDHGQAQAQAIIDELGLTVQEPVENYPNLLRLVVGRWN